MKHGDYFLTYRYTNASVEIILRIGGYPALTVDVCQMLKMSFGRPWNMESMTFDMIDVADENKVITILLENEQIMSTVTVSISDDGALHCEAEWINTSNETLRDVMLGITIPVANEDAVRTVIPSVCMDQSFDENGEFKCDCLSGGGLVVEEHRLPIPFASINNPKKSSITLFSIPSKCTYYEGFDGEWSMGIVKNNSVIELTLISGGVMLKGNKDQVLGGAYTVIPCERGYFDMPPEAKISKKFILYVCDVGKPGNELDRIIAKSMDLYNPVNELKVSYNDFLKYKSVALKNRFSESDNFIGYVKKLTEDHSEMHYTTLEDAWTVHNLSAAWCDAANSLQLRMQEGITRAKKCVDFYINSTKCKRRGLRQLYYNNIEHRWQYSELGDIVPSHEFGLMISYLADIILMFKDHCLDVPENWLNTVEDSCDFLCLMRKMTKAGMYPKYWLSDGAMGDLDDTGLGVTCVSALAKFYSITGDHEYMTVAIKAFVKYYDCIVLHHNFSVKHKKRLSDTSILADKESYVYFIAAAIDCYNATHDEKFLKMASAATAPLLSYVNFINYPVKKESKLSREALDMRGLSYSARNIRALNAIFPSYEFKFIGDITGDQSLTKTADMTVNAITQLISVGNGEYGIQAVGEQPVLFYTTNWSESGASEEWRGGYSSFNELKSLTWTFKQILKLTGIGIL